MDGKDPGTGCYNQSDGMVPVGTKTWCDYPSSFKQESLFHSQERAKAVNASPVLTCPSCKKPALGFSGGSNRYPLPAGVPLRHAPVVEMTYHVDGCGCTVEAWWAAAYSKELTSRLHGNAPKAIELPGTAERQAEWNRLQAEATEWYTKRQTAEAGDLVYANYRIMVIADKLSRLEAMEASLKPKGKTLMEIFDDESTTTLKKASSPPPPLHPDFLGEGYGKDYKMPEYAKTNQAASPFKPDKKDACTPNYLQQLLKAAGLEHVKITLDPPKAKKPLGGVSFCPTTDGKVRAYFDDPNIGSRVYASRDAVKAGLAELGYDVAQFDVYYPPPKPALPPIIPELGTAAVWWAKASKAAKASVPSDYKQKQMLEAYHIAKDLVGKSAAERADLLAYLAKQPDQGAMHKAVSTCLAQLLQGADPGLKPRMESGVLVNSGDDRVVGAVARVLVSVASHRRFALREAAKAWPDVPPPKLPERLEEFCKEARSFQQTRKLSTVSQEFVVRFLDTVRESMASGLDFAARPGEDPIMAAIAALDEKEKAAEKAAAAEKREAFHAQFARPARKIRPPARRPEAG